MEQLLSYKVTQQWLVKKWRKLEPAIQKITIAEKSYRWILTTVAPNFQPPWNDALVSQVIRTKSSPLLRIKSNMNIETATK